MAQRGTICFLLFFLVMCMSLCCPSGAQYTCACAQAHACTTNNSGKIQKRHRCYVTTVMRSAARRTTKNIMRFCRFCVFCLFLSFMPCLCRATATCCSRRRVTVFPRPAPTDLSQSAATAAATTVAERHKQQHSIVASFKLRAFASYLMRHTK